MDDLARLLGRKRPQDARSHLDAPQRASMLVDGLQRQLEALAGSMSFASDEELDRWKEREAIAERVQRLEHSGIAAVLDSSIVEALAHDRAERTIALSLVASWMPWALERDRPRTLVLLGSVGLGKTVAAAWALAYRPGRYVSSDELARVWSGHCRITERGFGHERDIWPALVSTGLLVIDEVGAARAADMERDALAEIVDRRRGKRLTLLMGNASAQQLRARLDARTIDRLNVGPVRRLEGPSKRVSRGGL